MREDYIRELRLAIASLKKTGLDRIDPKEIFTRLYIYDDLILEDALVGTKGLEFSISLKPFNLNVSKKKNQMKLNKTSRLMTGSLLIITNYSLNTMVYATVTYKPEQQKTFEKTGLIRLAIKILDG